jgi:uncharacterized membrane protein YcaP (DUF421 family)
MKKNMGSTDKIIRILIALAIGVLYYTEAISGTTTMIVLGVFAVVFLLTSLIGFCPLYPLFGISTCKKK